MSSGKRIDCPKPDVGALLFWNEPLSVVSGQTLPLTPSLSTHPGSYDPLPSACLKDIQVRPEGAARVEVLSNGDFALVVTDDAPLEETIRIKARYRDQSISARMIAYNPDASPLVGYWRQAEESCDSETIVRELIFSADGTFSVTWEPFETYKDYWGRYDFEAETGQLTLSVESGNSVTDVQNGTIRLENDQLVLGTASFGSRFGTLPECRAPFQ